jgi:hypothetical protein
LILITLVVITYALRSTTGQIQGDLPRFDNPRKMPLIPATTGRF